MGSIGRVGAARDNAAIESFFSSPQKNVLNRRTWATRGVNAGRAKAIVAIIRSWRPDLLEAFGVGPVVAATVLCAWSHPGRIHSEAAFAMLAASHRQPSQQRPGHHPLSTQPSR